MTEPVHGFPDVEALIIAALEDMAGGPGHVGYVTPANLAEVLPYWRVRRVAGPSDRLNDHPSFDVDLFAGTYTEASRLAERTRQFLCGPPPPVWQLDRIECPVGPRELPWTDPARVRRWGASYVATARRRVLL